MTRLWWVRHAPTGAEGFTGWTDRAAILPGDGSLERLRRALPEGAPVASSDLARATATAAALAPPERLLRPDPGLREIHFGRWEGCAFEAVDAEEGELLRAFWDAPGPVAAPGGESWDGLCARVHAAADRLAMQGGDVIVVAHLGPILSQVQRAREIPARAAFAQTIAPLSLTVLRWEAGEWRLERVDQRF